MTFTVHKWKPSLLIFFEKKCFHNIQERILLVFLKEFSYDHQ